MPLRSAAEYEPGLMAYHFAHSLYYANAAFFTEQVEELDDSANPDLEWFCVDAMAIDDVDYTGAAALRSAHETLTDKGIRMVFVLVSEHTRREPARLGITELVGEDAFFANGDAVIAAFRQRKVLGECAVQSISKGRTEALEWRSAVPVYQPPCRL